MDGNETAPGGPPDLPGQAKPRRSDEALHLLRAGVLSLVRDAGAPDPNLRQLATLLVTCTTPGPQTVRGLAAKLRISKPAVTRAVDVLVEHAWVVRKVDPLDRRSVNITGTRKGSVAVEGIVAAMTAEAAADRD